MKVAVKIFFMMMILFLGACSMNNSGTQSPHTKKNHTKDSTQTMSLLSWNAQTFFDGVTEGTEYREFQKSKNWSPEKYQVRLQRLAETLKTLDADVVVLQELENDAVMQDISNMMAGGSWNRKKLWPYGAFAKEKGQAIGCGIFSRYPIASIRTHSLDVRTEKSHQPQLRPLIQVTVKVDGRDLTIFVNHWKSKSGGEVETEPWRGWQEGVLAQNIRKVDASGCPSVAVGDFNKSIEEFSSPDNWSSNKIALKNLFSKSEKTIVRSPWASPEGFVDKSKGSYFYKGNWERIDNVFVRGDIGISSFGGMADGPWGGLKRDSY